MATSYFLPFATGSLAEVLSPGNYASQTWLSTGFQPGIADPASVNTVWRQGSFVAAGITQWMANTLNIDINDDGNLTSFITHFGNAITAGTGSGVTSFNTRTGAVTLLSSDVISALGYTPVRSFNGRTGAVTLTASDVNTALGYQAVNKAGDTMAGLLSGLTPTQPSHYATKGYVDTAVAGGHVSGNINGNSTELNFPLGDGGLIKVGQYFPSVPSYDKVYFDPSVTTSLTAPSYQINFVTPFKTKCISVMFSLIWEPQTVLYPITNANGPISSLPYPRPGTNTGLWINYSQGQGPFLTDIAVTNEGFYTDNVNFVPAFQNSNFINENGITVTNVPPGFIWTAIGY